MRADSVPGSRFPDYELTEHPRASRRLSELPGTDPMVLVLARGRFCPNDHQQHVELVAVCPRIAVACTKIVTISTDTKVSNALRRKDFLARRTSERLDVFMEIR